MLGRLRIVVVSAVVFAGVFAAPAPPAGAAAACTANVVFNYAPGITVLPTPPLGPAPVVTGTLVLTCPVLAADGGMWILPFGLPEVITLEGCGAGQGIVSLLAGAVGPPGAVAGGLVYSHVGPLFQLTGTLAFVGGPRNLVVEGVWAPVLLPGDCVTAGVTTAVATGVAVMV
jgi:hypothetical protein